MLLRLVPPAPLPTILFTLSFPTLPPTLPLPAAWENHLQLLLHYQLTAPPSLHALDKSVAWTALLETVTFDLVSLTVTCVFVDGLQEEWPLTNRCVDLLESVIRDVSRSATEADIEYELECRKTDVDFGQNSSSNSHTSLSCTESTSEHSPLVPQKVPKPKKRRSILASLMASLVPSSPFSALIAPYRSSTPPPAPPPPPSPIVIEDAEPLITNGVPASRFLRRRARSTLVDAYRRFVVGELGARFRTGDPTVYQTKGSGFKMHDIDPGVSQTPRYALWVTRSTMRRVTEEMARVIEHAMFTSQGRARDRDARQGTLQYAEKLKEDERNREDDRGDGDDSGSASSSTTDGSSVHTPLDFHDTPFPHDQSSSSQSKQQVSPPHTPTVMTPEAYHAYISLKEMHHRLHSIACQLTAEVTSQEQAAAVDAGGAEVRSKRRAWSSRQYVAGTRSPSSKEEAGVRGVLGGASMALIGLAVPVRSSPLCRGWSAEELEADELKANEGGEPMRWEMEIEHNEMVRRARSLCAEQTQRRRYYFGATGKSCDAEDVHGPGRIRPRPLDVNTEEGPFGLVYSTGPRHSQIEIGHATLHDEVLEEDEEEYDPKHVNVNEDEDDSLYEKRSEEEFILHPSEEPSTPLRPWIQTQVKTPQPGINKAVMANELHCGRSIPIELMLSKSLPTEGVDLKEICAEPSRLADPDSLSALEI